MSVLHVNREQNPVFVDDDRLVGNLAIHNARTEGKPFFFADFGIAAFVNASAVGLFCEQFVNDLTVDFGTCGKDFDGVDVGVLVDDAARNAVVFGVHEAECAFLVLNVEPAAFARGYCAVQDVAKEFTVYLDVLSFGPEGPETSTNLGFGGVGGKAQKIAVVAVNFDNVTKCGVANNFINGAAENPRVVTEGGLVTSGFQCNCFHS